MESRGRRRGRHASLLLWLALAPLLPAAAKKEHPVALEQSFKDRIGEKFRAAVDVATENIATRFGLNSGLFGGYELLLGDRGEPARWLHSCTEIDATRDTVELCANRQLLALTALCDADGFIEQSEEARELVKNHLARLALKDVPELGIRVMNINGADLWFHLKEPGSSADHVDVSPTLQASVLMAVARCGDALGETEHLQEAESWFVGLRQTYPQTMWNATIVNFHRTGMILEALSLVVLHLPAESSFKRSLLLYIEDLEIFLRQTWNKDSSIWSFATARALALRYRSGDLKTSKRRKKARLWAREHMQRFLGRMGGGSGETGDYGLLAQLGGASYMCGPLQGLAALASVLSSAELVQSVLQLMEKDVNQYLLVPGGAAPPDGLAPLAVDSEGIAGGFFRDENQMQMEKRRSIRSDDVSMCVIALTQSLQVINAAQGFSMEDVQQLKEGAATPQEEEADGNTGRAEEL
eukprot:NODE_6689_length_1648_cov_8.450362.p1 GENE.NODE_6689_length_1648_cov_8.450362~~NODE_6689_length_1648_cov_8.450362.p1  ORF type:complete len:469 (-),score=192.03 NODE_6689_length_1648_cov_8.450362:160-1566(-)